MPKKTKQLSPQIEAGAERYRESVCRYHERIIELLKTLKPGKTLAEYTIYRGLGAAKIADMRATRAEWVAALYENQAANDALWDLTSKGIVHADAGGLRLKTDKDRSRQQAEKDALARLERVSKALGKNTANQPVHEYGYGISINGPALARLEELLRDAGLL